MSSAAITATQSRSLAYLKIGLGIGVVCLAVASYLFGYTPYESDTKYNPAQPQYGIHCLSFEPSHNGPLLALQIIDRGESPTFQLFKASLHTEDYYFAKYAPIHLNVIDSSGGIQSLQPSKITNLLDTQAPVGHDSRITIEFNDYSRAAAHAEQYAVQLADFPPLELRAANPLVKLFPFLGGTIPLVALFLCGAMLIAGSGTGLYDARPIPDEFIPAPEPLNLTTDEAWRPRTNFRYLEELKQACSYTEERITKLYQSAVKGHRDLSNANGYIAYKSGKLALSSSTKMIAMLLPELAYQKAHIERVFAGDVRVDLQEMEEQIEKIRREREAQQDELLRAERAPADAAQNKEQERIRRNTIASFRDEIKRLDMRKIELESRVRELRDYDFASLYRALGVSPEAVRADKSHLSDIKDKVDITAAIKDKTNAQGAGNLTEEDERLLIKAKCEERLARLKSAKLAAVAAEDAPEGARRMENYYDDLIDKATQEWMKYQ